MIDLRNRGIMVTGASSGIGRQCAITCSQLGASLALVGRAPVRLAETRRLLPGTLIASSNKTSPTMRRSVRWWRRSSLRSDRFRASSIQRGSPSLCR